MPVMDGYAAVRAIRTLEADRNASRRLPIFALTAHAMAEDEAKCLEAGMDRYLTKPLERGKLAEAIRTVLQD
jgi:CheY-like chemotaxis protein